MNSTSALRNDTSSRRKNAAPLRTAPAAREMRDRFSQYVQGVLGGHTFTVKSRGKDVAILAPADGLPAGLKVMETVSTTDIKSGKRRLSLVAVHGPYAVERNGKRVAVLYSAVSNLPQRLERLFTEIEELKLLDDAKARRVQLRQRADEAIRARVKLLRDAKDDDAAKRIEAAHRELDLNI